MEMVSQQSGTSFSPLPLAYGTQYFWQVVVWDIYEDFTPGPVWSFTTAAANRPPDPPTNPSPADGATELGIHPTLSWAGNDLDGDTMAYDVYLGITSETMEMVSNMQTGTSFNPLPLAYGTQYFWQVVAWDNYEAHSLGPVWSFTTTSTLPPPYQLEYVSGSGQSYYGSGMPAAMVFKVQDTGTGTYLADLTGSGLAMAATASVGYQDLAFNNAGNYDGLGQLGWGGYYYVPFNTGPAYTLEITVTLSLNGVPIDTYLITENILGF